MNPDDPIASLFAIDRREAAAVRVLVMAGYGLNCEVETAAAFARLGARPEIRHVADILDGGDDVLRPYHLLVVGGGFSFGDHIASGRVFANRLRFRLGERLCRHIDDRGLVLGICNGFQTLVKLGALPALAGGDVGGGGRELRQQVSLVANDRLGYRDAWIRLACDPASPCVFTRGLGERPLDLPSRHGEGKLIFADDEVAAAIDAAHLVPVRYIDAAGVPTETWPDNPSGSPGGAAGLCDPSGRVFGLMPHPEAYLDPENHPRWRAQLAAGELPPVGLGLHLLAGGIRAILAGVS